MAAPARRSSVRDTGRRGAAGGERVAGRAVLLATAPSSAGGPAAGIRLETTTLLGRLIAQLSGLGVADFHVITRSAWVEQLERSLDAGGHAVRMHTSDDRAGDLRALAAIARDADRGALVVANADVLTQQEALAGLLADPRVATGILATTRSVSRVMAFRTRARRGALLGAGTPYHPIHQPNGTFLGVLKLGARDRAVAADVAERLADVLAGALPEAWTHEYEAKAARWRSTLHRHGALGVAEQSADDEVPEDPFDAEAAEVDEPAPPGNLALAPGEEAELRRRLAAAEQDVTALLLWGIVRSAVRVSTTHLRRLLWARPLSPGDIDHAAARIGSHDEEKALLESAVKANDGFFTTFFVSPYSKYIARWAARRGWNPNHVTAISVLVGLAAAGAFATGERAGLLIGAVLLQLAFMLDCVDGQLARYTRTFTAFGAWLDSIFDRTKEYAVFAGLALGSARAGDDVWLLAAAALTLQTTRHMMDFSFNIAKDQAMLPAASRPLDPPVRPPAVEANRRARSRDPVARPPEGRQGLGATLRRLNRSRRGRWIRKILAFPIGERFAAISLTAACFDARVTFIVVLALGTCAATYTGGGRVLRSLGHRSPIRLSMRAAPGPSLHAALRDDGPLARALGRRVGRRLAIPPIALVTAGALPLFAIAAIMGDDAPWVVASAVVGWTVIMGGVSAGRPLRDRLRWAVAPALRLVEYGGVLWLAALAGPAAVPAAFALLCAITLRHYDAFYRSRQRGDPPAGWVALAAGGWEGRLIAALALTAAGAAPAGLYVAAAGLAAMLVGESIASRIAHRRAEEPVTPQTA